MVSSDSPHADDLALKASILGGDRQAAEGFLEEHFDALYEFVHFRVGGDRSSVEDLVQDTFLVALERLHTFDGRSRLSTWLAGIAKNKLRELRRKRRPVAMEDLLAASDGAIESVLERVDAEPLPDWVLECQETREMVGATLSSLPSDYRRALLDKYVEDLSVSEMARRAGKSEKAAESHLARARLAFARVFQLLAKGRGGLA
jgi:RNA polymerase sigma-70 factor (ECF subfamily)